MAGGVGSRFWPMSKVAHPKQFIDILGIGQTLIQQTFQRFEKIIPLKNIYVVTNDIYRDIVKKQIPQIHEDNILCEPLRRNTAPCIAYASYKIYKTNPNANIVVSPSDHIIINELEFLDTIKKSLKITEKNEWLLTLGITPLRPDTGYGYIQYTNEIVNAKYPELKKVKTFTEKPSFEVAISFLESGDFLWNSGIFIWSVKSIIDALNNYLPELSSIFNDGIENLWTDKEPDFIKWVYSVSKNISIDYGIMEKAKNVYVMKSNFGWSDLGTWKSLFDYSNKDESNNVIIGNNVLTYNTHDCIVNVPKDKLVIINGLKNYIVVESDNILLLCNKDDEQMIRQFVNDVKIKKGDDFI